MKNSQILIFLGVFAVIIAIIWSNKSNASTTTTPTPKPTPATTPVPVTQVSTTAAPTPYDRYKIIYNKGVLLKANVQVYVKASASISAPYITTVYPNFILGRTTGRYYDNDNFRWVEIALSDEVNAISNLRIKLLQAGISKFWVQQDYVGQSTTVLIDNPLF